MGTGTLKGRCHTMWEVPALATVPLQNTDRPEHRSFIAFWDSDSRLSTRICGAGGERPGCLCAAYLSTATLFTHYAHSRRCIPACTYAHALTCKHASASPLGSQELQQHSCPCGQSLVSRRQERQKKKKGTTKVCHFKRPRFFKVIQ